VERVMREFNAQRSNLLLCSTIIESGIDIPTANTMVIHRADKFGLAQLHQLRGRVGRSHHQAYAYLLTPPEDALGAQAKKRLEAIQMMEQLGSGFYLAMHDLEIRGAGEVLGESQSGEIQEVGFSLYARMLERAVRALKSGRAPALEKDLDLDTEVNLHVPALLPASYCSDVQERLALYKRLADAAAPEQLEALREELVDRFGELPEPARALLECHQVRIAARPLGVSRVDATHEAVQLQFVKNPPLDGAKVIEFVRGRRNARLVGTEREIAAITAQAMRGEIDYTESLRRRVALLQGLEESALGRVYDERLRLTPGADRLLAACKRHRVQLLLVSGGFTFFTERLKA